MALHNITASGNQLVIELIVTEGDYAPSLITLKNPSIKLTTDRIKFLDSGIYQTALRFTDINEIGGVAPTDLEDAADLISALIANFSGGGSAPTYKVYTSLLTQTGTNAPVATVLENTLGDIVWTRNDVGNYTGTLAGAFTANRTILFVGTANDGDITSLFFANLTRVSVDEISLVTFINTTTLQDSIISNLSIEIRVYN